MGDARRQAAFVTLHARALPARVELPTRMVNSCNMRSACPLQAYRSLARRSTDAYSARTWRLQDACQTPVGSLTDASRSRTAIMRDASRLLFACMLSAFPTLFTCSLLALCQRYASVPHALR
jgi:hypothetical protein